MKKNAILLSFCLLLASCTPGPTQITEPEIAVNASPKVKSGVSDPMGDPPGCLSPIKTFEYQLGDAPNDIGNAVFADQVLPSQEWQKIANIPDASQLVLMQSRGNETTFWIDISTSGLIRYQIRDTKLPDEGTILPGPVDYLGGFHLFLDQENNVFGGRYRRLAHGETEALLNRYNEQTNQWEPVTIDLANQDALGIEYAEVDAQGKFWVLVRDGAETQLYSLDPQTMTTQRHLAEYARLDTSFTISNNSLFILAVSGDPQPRAMLLQYPLDGGAVKVDYTGEPIHYTYERTLYGYSPVSLFVDGQQRAWVGGRGWLDLSTNEWHYVIADPVFITVVGGMGKWTWSEPEITAETPDGRLWFNALRGTGWVDPKLGKWCVFTSYQSNVLPDNNGNLWLVADDGLYMRKK